MSIKKNILIYSFSVLISLISVSSYAFVVQRIQVQGAHRITRNTILSYLPVKVGQDFTDEKSGAAIEALYKTGFFSDVRLLRHDNTLIVKVVERPTIGHISVTGITLIKKNQINKALKAVGLEKSLVFSQTALVEMRESLNHLYYSRGHYSAKINIQVKKEARNRVSINVHVDEGAVAKIRSINIIGNHAYSTRELRKQFQLTTPSILTWLSKKDQYSAVQLEADLQSLLSFYLDHGYLHFHIVSTQVSLTPDKRSVYITITVDEGPQYRVSRVQLAGNLLKHRAELRQHLQIHPGDIFSRHLIIDTITSIKHYLGDMGYAYAKIDMQPQINEHSHRVNLTLVIDPGRRVYIRRITFTGNIKTADFVLRREMRSMEASLYSLSKLEESKRRLKILGFVKNIKVKTIPVPGHPDQVDLAYNTTDSSSASLSLNGGYSSLNGFFYGFSVNEHNFLGTGKTVGVGLNRSQYSQSYYFSYYNPYYTVDGVGRGFNIYYQKTTPEDVNLDSYKSKNYGLEVNYSIPVTEYSYLGLATGYERTLITQQGLTSQKITEFLCENGSQYDVTKVSLTHTYNSLNRALMPEHGFHQILSMELGFPLFKRSLDYYKISLESGYYQPLYKGFILYLHSKLGVGGAYGHTTELPFFKNFYAGGIGTVRGYATNSLGPKELVSGSLVAQGGNIMTVGSIGLVVPTPLPKSARVSVFIDGGNVYDSDGFNFDVWLHGRRTPGTTVRTGGLRFSAGVQFDIWVSFLGSPVEVSLATPLNKRRGDDLQAFQFTLGTSF